MRRTLMKSKLHHARVTQADLHYVGSITIDRELMEAADLLENEKVQVVVLETGARLETYVIADSPGSRTICLNGAAARLAQPGDTVIIISYAELDDREAKAWVPTVLVLDEHNDIVGTGPEIHGMTA